MNRYLKIVIIPLIIIGVFHMANAQTMVLAADKPTPPPLVGFCANMASGTGLGDTPANAAPSCRTILDLNPSATSGVYFLDVDGPSGPELPFRGYCDMTTDGGGWWLIHKSRYTTLGPHPKEMAGHNWAGTTDPWGGWEIAVNNTGLQTSEFNVADGTSTSLATGYRTNALLSPSDNLASQAPTELYTIVSREIIDIYRRSGCYGTPTLADVSSGNSSVLRFEQSSNSIIRYISDSKRFNPASTVNNLSGTYCNPTTGANCEPDLIFGHYNNYNATTHIVSNYIGFISDLCSTVGTFNNNQFRGEELSSGRFISLVNGFVSCPDYAYNNVTCNFYDLSTTDFATSGAVIRQAGNDSDLPTCNSAKFSTNTSGINFVTLYLK